MLKGRILFAVLLICCLNPLQAQVETFSLRKFDNAPELSNAAISFVFPDSKGFIWIGTNAGLFRFDGQSFKVFRNTPGDSTSIAYNYVYAIDEDKAGNLWIGLARKGISFYNRTTGQFTNYPITRHLTTASAPVTGIYVDEKERVWAGIEEYGIIQLDKKTGKTTAHPVVTQENSPHLSAFEVQWNNHAYHFWTDPETSLVWMTTRSGFFLLNPETSHINHFNDFFGNTQPVSQHNVWNIHIDGDWIWTGGWESGLKKVNRKTGEIVQYFYNKNVVPGEQSNIINGVTAKNNHELWVNTQDRGLGIFNKSTGQFHFFDQNTDALFTISSGPTSHAVKDRQGNIWFVHKEVLCQLIQDKALFEGKSLQQGNKRLTIRQIFEDQSGRYLFMATHGFVGFRVTDQWTNKQFDITFTNPKYITQPILLAQSVRQDANGNFWALTSHRLYPLDLENKKLLPHSPIPVYSIQERTDYYSQMEIDHHGRIWIGTYASGLIQFSPSTNSTKRFIYEENNPNSLPTDNIGVVAIDGRNRCWFGSLGRTAYGYFLEDENRFVRLDIDGKATKETTSARVNSVNTDSDGNIWVSTECGLLFFDCQGKYPKLVRKYTITDGLPSDYVIEVAQDARGNMWGMASLQLFCVEKGTNRIFNYRKSDGLYFLSTWGVYRTQNGKMMIYGGSNHYVEFDPEKLPKAKLTVELALVSFKADNTELYASSLPVPQAPLVLPLNTHYFSIEIAALEFENGGLYEYEYQLSGFSEAWIKVGSQRSFGFTGMPPGDYTFRIKIVGAPDNEAISIPFKIRISFYRTNWFWGLLLLTMAALGIGYYQNRQHQKRQLQLLKSKTQLLEKEKAIVMYESLKQQLNPHFLFNSLTSLSSLIQISPKSAAVFLDNLSKTYRYILRSSEYEQVPLSEELKFAESFVNLQKTRFEHGLEVYFDVPPEYFQRKIVPVTLQNLLENAIKHNVIDEESPLIIRVFIENNYLVTSNNLQRKKYVETSNQKGLAQLRNFYQYLSSREIIIEETATDFKIKIPLL